jgi:hypothetical protein
VKFSLEEKELRKQKNKRWILNCEKYLRISSESFNRKIMKMFKTPLMTNN